MTPGKALSEMLQSNTIGQHLASPGCYVRFNFPLVCIIPELEFGCNLTETKVNTVNRSCP